MAKRWRIHSHDPQRVAQLERSAGIPAVVAQLLLARGMADPQAAREFLDAKLSGLRDPELLPGAADAAQRLAAAIAAGRKICVYGDYDADGMTATAILLLALQTLGANATYYVPSRIDEGYGLNHEALRSLAASGVETVVTVDCGIASADEAETAREVGLELIVTDHHEFGPRLPEAVTLVHPRLPGTNYPFPGLAGAGVAFKVAWALCQQVAGAKRVGERMKQFLLQALGLAAIGTVADVVPLVDENRILVTHGLNSLREFPTLGLAELLRVTELREKARLSSEDIGFTIGPRLNAAGRLGQAQLAIELLTTNSAERAAALADYIHQLNDSRTSLERSIYLAANKQATEQFDPENDAALVLAERGWHPGVIGIVAGRLAEKFHRPVILIAQDDVGVKPGIGSARGIPNFSLHAALAACGRHLISHGGHAAAAGLRIEDAQVEAFRQDFVELAATEIAQADLVAELFIDAKQRQFAYARGCESNRAVSALRARQSPPDALRFGRAAGRASTADGGRRTTSFDEARTTRREAARGRFRQGRLGRRDGGHYRAGGARFSAGHQLVSRSAKRGTARERLASLRTGRSARRPRFVKAAHSETLALMDFGRLSRTTTRPEPFALSARAGSAAW